MNTSRLVIILALALLSVTASAQQTQSSNQGETATRLTAPPSRQTQQNLLPGAPAKLSVGGSNFTVDVATGNTQTAGDMVVSGTTTTGAQRVGSHTATPLAAAQHDYAISPTATLIRLSVEGDANKLEVTGFSGGVDGRMIVVVNVGTKGTIVLKNQDAQSFPLNRIQGRNGGDVGLSPGTTMQLIYDAASGYWRAY